MPIRRRIRRVAVRRARVVGASHQRVQMLHRVIFKFLITADIAHERGHIRHSQDTPLVNLHVQRAAITTAP